MSVFSIVFIAIGCFIVGVLLTTELSKDKEATDWIFIDNERYFINPEVHKYIKKLEDGVDYYKSLSNGFEKELKEIKPVLEAPGLKPAVSLYCERCKFALRSSYNKEVLGCRKDVLCKDFSSINYLEER